MGAVCADRTSSAGDWHHWRQYEHTSHRTQKALSNDIKAPRNAASYGMVASPESGTLPFRKAEQAGTFVRLDPSTCWRSGRNQRPQTLIPNSNDREESAEDLHNQRVVFVVKQLNQFGSQPPSFHAVTSMLVSDERGNGVFRFWRGIAWGDRIGGIWVYQFYDAAVFMVTHTSRPKPFS
jgi:hypothetical protein